MNHLKQWPSDAVIIVAANRGDEKREAMESVVQAVCRECGELLAADSRTVRTAMNSPLRLGRPVEFFCIPCCVQHDPTSPTHFADHRFHPGIEPQPVSACPWQPAE